MATLKIRLESRKMAPSSQVRLDVHRLRDDSVTHRYKRERAERLGESNDGTTLRQSRLISRPKS